MGLTEQVADVLDEAGYPYDVDEDEDEGTRIFRLTFIDGDHDLEWTCVAYPLEETGQFVFFSVAPDDVPEEARSRVAEYLTRANYGLVLGNFEMDWSDGEVRCRTSVQVSAAQPATELIRPVIGYNLGLMTQYLAGLVEVAAGTADPEAAVTEAEATPVAPFLR